MNNIKNKNYRKHLEIQSNKELEVYNFIIGNRSNLFISISFANQLINKEVMRKRLKLIFTKYYEYKYGGYWFNKKDFHFDFWYFKELGKTGVNPHYHIMLNSNGISTIEFAEDLIDALKDFYLTEEFNIYYDNSKNASYRSNSIVIKDIYDEFDLAKYSMKEVNFHREFFDIDFSSMSHSSMLIH